MSEGRVAVLGMGAMGSRMARRLEECGLRVTVWNRTPERCGGFADAASTPSEAVDGARLAILMLADVRAIDEVTRGLPPGLCVVDMSTSGPGAPRLLASRFELPVDAPVGGSISEAEEGALSVFASGEEAALDRAQPVLEELGSVRRVGPLGAGQVVKLTGNLLMLANVAALGEGLAMARRAGLDPDLLLDALEASPGDSRALRRKGRQILDGSFGPPARFALRHALKDADLARDLARETRSSAFFAGLVGELLAHAVAQGRGEQDYSAVAGAVGALGAAP
jgi:3-hydroxyisobutyrate dehydrogenase-like beta-hydroxyacid dehydrogenase